MEYTSKVKLTIALGLLLFAAGCGGGDPFATPPPDAGQLTAEAAYAANMQYYAEQTAQANATVPPSATQTPRPEVKFAADLLLCAPVDGDGTVSDAVFRANGSIWPPYSQNGVPMHVSLDHNGTRQVAELQTVMGGGTALDVASVGDQVCIAVNKGILERQPTPTPQSSLPTRGRIFAGGGQGFAPARSSKSVGFNQRGVRIT
ncbi:MAG: hypothetical protein WAV30_04400 [Microgenomates group bacterium]